MKSWVLWSLPLFPGLSHPLGLDETLPSCAITCLEDAAPGDGSISLEVACQGGQELQNLIHCIFTECDAEPYAPAVRKILDACFTAAKKASTHSDAHHELRSLHRRTSSPEQHQDEARSPRNDKPTLDGSSPNQNMGDGGSQDISNRSGLATFTLTVTKYVSFSLPGGGYSGMDNISIDITGSEHIGMHDDSNPAAPARMVVDDARPVPLAPSPPTPARHMDRTVTAFALAANPVADFPDPTATSFITITMPISPVQQGGYTPPVTTSCESLHVGDGSGIGGTAGPGPTGASLTGPADVSGVVPPISSSYSYASVAPSQVTTSRGCKSLALSVLPFVVLAQAAVLFFGVFRAP